MVSCHLATSGGHRHCGSRHTMVLGGKLFRHTSWVTNNEILAKTCQPVSETPMRRRRKKQEVGRNLSIFVLNILLKISTLPSLVNINFAKVEI